MRVRADDAVCQASARLQAWAVMPTERRVRMRYSSLGRNALAAGAGCGRSSLASKVWYPGATRTALHDNVGSGRGCDCLQPVATHRRVVPRLARLMQDGRPPKSLGSGPGRRLSIEDAAYHSYIRLPYSCVIR